MRKFAVLVFGLIVCGAVSFVGNALAQPLNPEPRIVSGYKARLGQFPWQVLIKEDEYDSVLCGGSILSSQWVLTAAHCCERRPSLLLRFGTIDLDNDSDMGMTATEMHIHPSYDTKENHDDVCLIKLPSPLQFSNTIGPIALLPMSQASNSFVDTIAVISGFGIMDDEYLDPSEELLWAQIKIIENSVCKGAFKEGVIVDSIMCGKGYDVYNMSICNGDSGGPLVAHDQNGNFIQIGINSFVPMDECTVGKPSAYQRISSYLSYIYNVTGLTPV